MQQVSVVVGGQYGSEAKGHVTAQLVKMSMDDAHEWAAQHPEETFPETINVRVAGPNAGHTVYDANGEKFALRQIPVGAVTPGVKLYIAPGSEIDLDVLYDEINTLEHSGHHIQSRLFISRQATRIETVHKEREAELVGAVGSTGKGIGAARADRLMRQAQTIGDYFDTYGDAIGTMWEWAEPEDLYATDQIAHDRMTHVIVEGTQGYGLSLRASGHYPQVTSSDARSVDFLAMAGIDPTRCSVKITNWVVCRVYPIRVAGNSGPMLGETTWDILGLEAEKTTVTQKVRRVGQWDPELVARAVQANGGHQAKVVITMLDQIIPELADVDPEIARGEEGIDPKTDSALESAMNWINENANYDQIGAHVAGITFGPTKMLFTNHADEPDPTAGLDIQAILGQILGGGQ